MHSLPYSFSEHGSWISSNVEIARLRHRISAMPTDVGETPHAAFSFCRDARVQVWYSVILSVIVGHMVGEPHRSFLSLVRDADFSSRWKVTH